MHLSFPTPTTPVAICCLCEVPGIGAKVDIIADLQQGVVRTGIRSQEDMEVKNSKCPYDESYG